MLARGEVGSGLGQVNELGADGAPRQAGGGEVLEELLEAELGEGR